MVTKAQLAHIKKAEDRFLQKVEDLQKEYRIQIRTLIKTAEKLRMEKIRKELN